MSNAMRTRTMAAAGLVCLSLLIGAGGASAASPVTVPPTVAVSTAPMTVVGIDDAVAAKAGNRVALVNGYKVLYDGVTGAELARVPLAATNSTGLASGAVTPLGQVTGNCGTAYMYLRDSANTTGHRNYQFSTGWDLISGKAYDFDWDITIDANWGSGVYHFEWSDSGPILLAQHWTSGWRTDDTDAPYGTNHVARVTYGTAYKTDGVICFSGYPTGNVVVY